MTGIERVRAYYEDLNTGDAEAVSAHFTEDAVHYYTRLGPHGGGRTIADYAALAVRHMGAVWTIEDMLSDGERVVIDRGIFRFR